MHTLVDKCSRLLLGLCAALQCVKTKQGTRSMEGKTCLTLVLLLQKTTQNFPHLWDQPYFLRCQQKLNTKRDPGRMSIQLLGVGLRGIGYLCVRGSVLASALGLFHHGLQSNKVSNIRWDVFFVVLQVFYAPLAGCMPYCPVTCRVNN